MLFFVVSPATAVIGLSPGSWSLKKLGLDAPLTLNLSHGSEGVKYHLHRSARQGPGLWFVVRLRARVAFAPGDGDLTLSASTSSYTAVQVLIKSRDGRVTADLLDFVDGHRVVTAKGRFIDVVSDNYAQVNAIQPGLGRLVFSFASDNQPTASVTIRESSGIEVTKVKPDELQLGTGPRQVVVQQGDAVSVPFTLSRRGGRPDGATRVVLSGAGAQSRTVRFQSVGGGRRSALNLTAPERTGVYLLRLAVPDRYNQPAVSESVRVVADISAPSRWKYFAVIAALAIFVGTTAWGFLCRRYDA